MTEHEFLWEHFKFNAEQRLKGFNFFVLLSIFSNGGVFTAIEKKLSPVSLVVIGLFILILAAVFWLVDTRSQRLIRLTIPAMKIMEQSFSCPESRLFELDAKQQGCIVRYTFAFKMLMASQFLFGAGVVTYGVSQLLC